MAGTGGDCGASVNGVPQGKAVLPEDGSAASALLAPAKAASTRSRSGANERDAAGAGAALTSRVGAAGCASSEEGVGPAGLVGERGEAGIVPPRLPPHVLAA